MFDEGSLGVKIIVIVPFSSLAAQSKSGVKIGLSVSCGNIKDRDSNP